MYVLVICRNIYIIEISPQDLTCIMVTNVLEYRLHCRLKYLKEHNLFEDIQ